MPRLRDSARRTCSRKCTSAAIRKPKRPKGAQASVTLGAMVERYLVDRAAKRLKPRSFEEVERHLKRHWSAPADLPIRKVTRSDVENPSYAPGGPSLRAPLQHLHHVGRFPLRCGDAGRCYANDLNTTACSVGSTRGTEGCPRKNSSTAARAPGHVGAP
jgi:hypothetical protein